MYEEARIHIFFSVCASIVAIIGEIWYNYSIYCNKTRPDRLAWWMLSLSSVMFTSSHFALGGIWTAIVPSIIAVGEIATSILSISRGTKVKFTSLDVGAFVIALISLFIWWFFNEPRIALFANITVSTVGMILCIKKAYLLTDTEALGPWITTVFADALNMFAIGQGALEWIVPTKFLALDGMMLITVICSMEKSKIHGMMNNKFISSEI